MLTMSTESVKKFLRLLWGHRVGVGEFRMIQADTGIVDERRFENWPPTATTTDALMDALSSNLFDHNIFMGVLLRTAHGKGDAAHTEDHTEWLWADVDQKSGGTFSNILRKIKVEPQMVVDSGNGWHLYWHLKQPVPVDAATGAMKVLAEELGGDAVGDPARILRLPGTINLKDGGLAPVRLLRFDPSTRVTFSDFDRPRPKSHNPYTFGPLEGDWDVSTADAPKFGEGERNHGLTRLAGAMLLKGLDEDEMLIALSMENEVRCNPPLTEREVSNIVRSVQRYRR